MSKLKVGQAKSYRIQKDAMNEFGYNLKCACRGAYKLNDSADVWFPIMTQSAEDIAVRGYGNYEIDNGRAIVEIASDENRLSKILKGIDSRRIAFPRHKGKPYCFYGLYKYDGVDKGNRRVTWKRIAAEIDTGDYPVFLS